MTAKRPGASRPVPASGARWDGEDLVLVVKVVPRAAARAVIAEADCLKVRLTAPPSEGKANRELCLVLADLLGVAKSRVSIEAGAGGRLKRVRVVGPVTLPDLLARA